MITEGNNGPYLGGDNEHFLSTFPIKSTENQPKHDVSSRQTGFQFQVFQLTGSTDALHLFLSNLWMLQVIFSPNLAFV